MLRAAPYGLSAAMLVLAACTPPKPLTVPEAERFCARDIVNSPYPARPRTSVSIGIGSWGDHIRPSGSISWDVTPGGYDRGYYGGDLDRAFHRCVKAQTGQKPTRELYQMPGWGPND